MPDLRNLRPSKERVISDFTSLRSAVRGSDPHVRRESWRYMQNWFGNIQVLLGSITSGFGFPSISRIVPGSGVPAGDVKRLRACRNFALESVSTFMVAWQVPFGQV